MVAAWFVMPYTPLAPGELPSPLRVEPPIPASFVVVVVFSSSYSFSSFSVGGGRPFWGVLCVCVRVCVFVCACGGLGVGFGVVLVERGGG